MFAGIPTYTNQRADINHHVNSQKKPQSIAGHNLPLEDVSVK